MRRTGYAAIEIARDAVRGLSLSGGARHPRLSAWCERKVDTPRDVASALGEVAEQLDPGAPVRLLLSGPDVRIERFSVAVARHWDGDAMIRDQLFEGDAAEAGRHLVGFRVEGTRLGRRRAVTALAVPRDPVETWCALLATLGHPVEGITSPGALVLAEKLPRQESLLWADLAESRTGLCVVRGGRLVEETVLHKPGRNPDEPIAAVEARLQDLRAIDRVVRESGAGSERPNIEHIILCGASSIAEPLYQQLREPFEKLGLTLELRNPWTGVAVGGANAPSAEQLVRLSSCLRLARYPSLPLQALPRRVARTARADRLWAAAALVSLAVTLAASVWMVALSERHRERLAARERAELTLEAARADAQSAESMRQTLRRRYTDWSPLLVDLGHLARAGVDYDRLVLDLSLDTPRIGLAGSARSPDALGTADLITRFHEQVFTTPYRDGIPAMAAASDEDARVPAAAVRFAVEETLSAEPGGPSP